MFKTSITTVSRNLWAGKGKTTPPLLIASMSPHQFIFWFLPLSSMHEQYRRRFTEHGLSFETWSYSSHPSTAAANILVVMEQASDPKLRDFVDQLLMGKHVVRVVLDEVHLALTHDSFRPIMELLEWLGQAGVQILLMSATVPPTLEEATFERLGVKGYVVCRERTVRPNISYNVIVTKGNIHNTLEKQYRSIMAASPNNQVLIFCRSKDACEQTALRLGLPFCNGRMPSEQVDAILGQLRDRKIRGIVCTSLLGVSLDVADVQYVIHLDYPYDVISFLQESGRCGRRPNTLAYSIVIVPPTHHHIVHKGPDRFGANRIVLWANSRLECRRLALHDFNDGESEPCSMMTTQAHLCDVCKSQSSSPPEPSSLDSSSTLSTDLLLLQPRGVRE